MICRTGTMTLASVAVMLASKYLATKNISQANSNFSRTTVLKPDQIHDD